MDFWKLLEENRLMFGDAAQICEVTPRDILDWWNHGVPDGMTERLSYRIQQRVNGVSTKDA